MKKILLVFAMIVCMTTCFVGGAFAQGAQFDNEQEIPWINYSIDIANATLKTILTDSIFVAFRRPVVPALWRDSLTTL